MLELSVPPNSDLRFKYNFRCCESQNIYPVYVWTPKYT